MEHAQPLDRSFPWRTTVVALVLVALAGLAALEGGRVLHAHGAAARTPSTVAAKRPAAPAAVPLRPRSRVSVLVLNGNGSTGAAGAQATRLLADGYRSATAADAPVENYATSLVLYRPGWQAEARRFAREAGAKVVAPLDGRLPAGSGRDELVLILGR